LTYNLRIAEETSQRIQGIFVWRCLEYTWRCVCRL